MFTKEKIISYIVAIVLMFFTHLIIQSNSRFVESKVEKLSTEILESHATVLERTISRNTKSAIILGQFIKELNGDISKFDDFAEVLYHELKGVSNLQLAPNGIVSYIHPLKGNEKAIGHNLFKDDARKKEAFLARKSHELTLAGPFKLIQGGVGMVARKPIYINDTFWGFSSALIILDDLVSNTKLDSLKDKNYIYRIKRIHPDTKKMEIFYGSNDFSNEKNIFTKEIIVPNGVWYLDIQYKGSYFTNSEIFVIYLIGFIISILLGYLLYIILNRPKDLEKINIKLEEKVKEQTKNIQDNLDLIGKYVLYSRTDLTGKIVEVSEAFCKLSGYSKEELLGNNHRILRDPKASKDFYKNLWITLKEKNIWTGEFKNIAKSGHTYWISSVITPEYDKFGKHIGYISIRHDITARKSFEEQQLEYFQNAKMIAMGEMIGNIAHQWRQPLSAISSLASGIILQKEANLISDEELNEKLNNIVRNTVHLSKTIDTFRNFLKIQTNVEKYTIQELLSSSILILKATLKETNINLTYDENQIEPLEIELIPGQFEQVILNILNNSRDVLLEKNILNPWIKINLELLKDKVIISIEDNGGGIKDDVMPHIFEPYFTTKHQTLGTGLGLNMSYRIINESLNGNLYAKNSENGAIFIIELPLN